MNCVKLYLHTGLWATSLLLLAGIVCWRSVAQTPNQNWIVELRHSDPKVRITAIWALASARDDLSIPSLIEVLSNDKDRDVRAEAAAAIANFGKKASRAVPSLIGLLKTEGELGELRKPLHHFRSSRPPGESVVLALASVGSEAVPELVKTFLEKKNRYSVRRLALEAVSRMNDRIYHEKGREEAEGAIDGLIQLIKDHDDELVFRAIDVLAEFGDSARSAIPVLIPLAKGRREDVKVVAAYALNRIDQRDHSSLAILLDLLRSSDVLIRKLSVGYIMSLTRLGQARSPDAVKALILALKNDAEVHVRMNAANALGYLGPYANESLPALEEGLKDRNVFVRENVAKAIESIRQDVPPRKPGGRGDKESR